MKQEKVSGELWDWFPDPKFIRNPHTFCASRVPRKTLLVP